MFQHTGRFLIALTWKGCLLKESWSLLSGNALWPWIIMDYNAGNPPSLTLNSLAFFKTSFNNLADFRYFLPLISKSVEFHLTLSGTMLCCLSSQHYLEKENFPPYFYNHVCPWQVGRSCAWLWTALESRCVLRKQEVLGTFQIAVHQLLKSKYTHLAGIKSLVSDAGHMTFLTDFCTFEFII